MHAGPWSRRCRPSPRATAHLNSPARPPGRPTQAFYSPGPPAAPAEAGLHFKARGSLPAANQRGKPVGGGGFKRRQIAAPSGRWTGWGLEGWGRGGRFLGERRGALGVGVSCEVGLVARTPRPPWEEKGSEGLQGTPGQRHTATPVAHSDVTSLR